MTRLLALAALSAAIVGVTGSHFAAAAEPKSTGTVDISSSVPDVGKLNAFQGVGVLLEQKEWEKLAAAWGIKDVPKVDFTKELLLVGTWRGSNFKFLGDVKDGNLTVELVGEKDVQPGFRYKVISLKRDGITKFQGKELPKATASEVKPIEEKASVQLTGDLGDRALQSKAPSSGVITSQKDWDVLVREWKIKDAPKVDFSKDILVVVTSEADSLTVSPTVKNGDLTVITTPGKQKREGFRWRVISVPREGVKTFNGKPLPQR